MATFIIVRFFSFYQTNSYKPQKHLKQMFQIRNFTPRSYQLSMSESALKKNTLIVLPTGLGKTKIAVLAVTNRMNLYPQTKALILTPTKPLANQIRKEFLDSTDIKGIVTLTGEIPPKKREDIIISAKIIISTPQTISNDIINRRIDLKEFSTLVLDEAHRNVKEYDYTWICQQYHKTARFPRIIGLTASPGSDIESIQEVCKKAYIEEIEIRTETDEEILEHIQQLDAEWIKIDLPEEYKIIQSHLNNSFISKIEQIKSFNIASKINLTKTELLSLLKFLHAKMAKGEKDFQILKSISLTAEAIKVQHALELLETQGIPSLYKYIQNIYEEAEKTKTKAIKNLTKDNNFHSAYIKAKELFNQKSEHPKVTKLKEIAQSEVKNNPKTKIMIFTQYRDTAQEIKNILNDLNLTSEIFVGQTKKNGTGLSQKEQLNLLTRFKDSEFNILISTSIGEEGLDIPKVNIVIFYEPIPSAIRTIQRRGRTARHETGKLIILMTKNTRDEAYHWVAFHKEKRMHAILKDLKNKIQIKEQHQTSLAEEFKTAQIEIIADTREQNSQITKELINQGVKVTTKQLEVADYIIANEIGIERKEVSDFVASIIDKRLLNQVKNLRNNFLKPLLIIEGNEDIYSIRKIHPNAIRGMLSAIALDFHVPIIYTKSQQETASLIKIIAHRAFDDKIQQIPLRLERKPLTTKELQEFIVESFPGIGPANAKSLLKELKSIKNIANSEIEKLKSVEGIGHKKAEEIKRILEEEY